jgi:F0F1-type ATP synthase delta subunit
MTATELTNKLLEHAVTRGEILRRIGTIRDFLEQKFYQPNPVTLVEFVTKRNTDGDPEVLQKIGEDFYSSFTRENMYTLIENITKEVNTLPAVAVTVPYLPDASESTKLGSWFKANVSGRMLVDLKFDPSIVGGCTVVVNGMWQDYTIRYFMQKKQNEIVETIGKYVSEVT